MSDSTNNRSPSAAQLNERLDWMFVDLLTLVVGLLVMQVFILPALRASQSKGVPLPKGTWLFVELRIKGTTPSEQKRPPFHKGEWGIYVINDMMQAVHGDEPGSGGLIQTPQYGDNGTLSFVIRPKDGELYTLGVWLQSLTSERLEVPEIQSALLHGLEFRVRPLARSAGNNDEEGGSSWTPLDAANAYHARVPLTTDLWQSRRN